MDNNDMSNPYNTRSQATGNLDQDQLDQDFSNQQDISSGDQDYYTSSGNQQGSANTQSYGVQGLGQQGLAGDQQDTTGNMYGGNNQGDSFGTGQQPDFSSDYGSQQQSYGQQQQRGLGGGNVGTQQGNVDTQQQNQEEGSLADKVEGMLEKLANKISGGPSSGNQ